MQAAVVGQAVGPARRAAGQAGPVERSYEQSAWVLKPGSSGPFLGTGDEMQDVVGVLLMFVPLIAVLWLGSFADRAREREQRDPAVLLAVLSILILSLLYLALMGLGFVLSAVGVAIRGNNLPPAALEGYRSMGVDPAQLAANLPMMGLSLWLPSIFGLILLLPPVRRLAARAIPIDPARTVHAVALSFPALIIVNLWFTVSFGLGNLATIAQFGASQGQPAVTLPGVWLQEIMLAVMAVIGVGWLSRRSLRETLQRLAIVRPSVRQVATGFGIGLLLVPLALVIEYVANRLGIGVNNDVQRLSEQLIGPLGQSIAGILTLGLAAALGEETLFRGALQPRFSLPLTALLFALLHSTYGLSLSSLVVFLLGLVLGLVRIRANTSTSMVVHATYNMTLGLFTYLGLFKNF
jgi:uncharacterized protein